MKEIAAHKSITKGGKIPTHKQSFALFEAGCTVQEIAEKRELSENTVYGHLMKIHAEGVELDMHQFVSADEINKISEAKESLTDADSLKAFFEYFEEKMPYWKIKLGLYLLHS